MLNCSLKLPVIVPVVAKLKQGVPEGVVFWISLVVKLKTKGSGFMYHGVLVQLRTELV
jgi:hypothetical protein